MTLYIVYKTKKDQRRYPLCHVMNDACTTTIKIVNVYVFGRRKISRKLRNFDPYDRLIYNSGSRKNVKTFRSRFSEKKKKFPPAVYPRTANAL